MIHVLEHFDLHTAENLILINNRIVIPQGKLVCYFNMLECATLNTAHLRVPFLYTI